MKAIYVEAFSGISGNMFLGGLLNLGVPVEYITDEIAKMQNLISELTALSATVQAEELRNKDLATAKFAQVRAQAKKVNSLQGAVNSYNQNMGKLNVVDPQFLDKKN